MFLCKNSFVKYTSRVCINEKLKFLQIYWSTETEFTDTVVFSQKLVKFLQAVPDQAWVVKAYLII